MHDEAFIKTKPEREIKAKFRIFRDRRIYTHDTIDDDRSMYDPSYESSYE